MRTRRGGSAALVDLDTGQRTQSWLAVSDDRRVNVSGGYWHNLAQYKPASEAEDVGFQDELLARLQDLTGVALRS